MRRLAALLFPALLLVARTASADTEIVLDGTAPEGGLDHFFVPFEVPAGVAEIEVQHLGTVAGNVLDFGLNDPAGFRGWGGGNKEPAIVGGSAASRSYLAGPLPAGTWNVVVGKANIAKNPATYTMKVVLRDAPTLPAESRVPYTPVAALKTEARFYAGDFHTHSRDSGDAKPSLDELATFARAQGLDFAEVSDHNTISQLDFFNEAQAKHPDLLLLPGIEYTTYDGHGNAIGATKWFDHKIGQPGVTIQGVVDEIRGSGALFSINHPALDIGDLCIGCGWKHEVDPDKIDAVEVSTGKADSLFGDATIAFWEALLDKGSHAAAIGGSDDHKATEMQDTFGSPIGEPTTMVFATELSAAAIVAGVKSGRTVVRLTGKTAAMIELTSSVAIPPGSSRLEAATTTLTARVTGGTDKALRFVQDGKPTSEEPIEITSDPFDATLVVNAFAGKETRVRAEVIKGTRRESVTSHVFVRAPGNAGGAGGTSGGGAGAGAGPGSGGAAGSSVAPAPIPADEGCGCSVVGREAALGSAALALLAFGLGAARRGVRRNRSDEALSRTNAPTVRPIVSGDESPAPCPRGRPPRRTARRRRSRDPTRRVRPAFRAPRRPHRFPDRPCGSPLGLPPRRRARDRPLRT